MALTVEVAAPLGPAPPAERPLVGGAMSTRRFTVGLVGVVAAGLGWRVCYVLVFTRHEQGKLYDSFWYGTTANELSLGQFFRKPFGLAPTAAHPPLTSLILGGSGFVVGRGITAQLLVMAVVGGVVVLVVGLLGRAVAGPWVGLVAAGLAAVAPNFWMPSGILMSEAPAMLCMALVLLAVVHLLRSPTLASAVLLGAACAVEALVRAELVLFVPALLVPAVLVARRVSGRRRVELLAAGLLSVAVVLGPWVGRNLATFPDATYLSTGDGLALLGANCHQTYAGAQLGSWSESCAVAVSAPDESADSARAQHTAVVYAEDHMDRVPLVVLARVGRVWDFYQPFQMAHVDANEGRPVPASLAGLWFYYALLPLGVAGAVVLRRRRIPQWFLWVPAGVVTVVAAAVFGLVRFRSPFEVCLVVLAAPAVVVMAQWVGRRLPARHRARPAAGTDGR